MMNRQEFEQIITRPYWWSKVNIGSGNRLVPSDDKSLPEPMLTKIYMAALGLSEMNFYFREIPLQFPEISHLSCKNWPISMPNSSQIMFT